MMFKKFPLILFIAIVSCKKEKVIPISDEKPNIKQVMKSYRDAWLNRDTTKILNCLTDDIVLFRSEKNEKPIFGKKAISKFLFNNGNFPYSILSYNTSNEEIYYDNNLAFYQGVSRYFWCLEENGVKIDTIFSVYDFTNILIKENGKWKIDRITTIPKNKDYIR